MEFMKGNKMNDKRVNMLFSIILLKRLRNIVIEANDIKNESAESSISVNNGI